MIVRTWPRSHIYAIFDFVMHSKKMTDMLTDLPNAGTLDFSQMLFRLSIHFLCGYNLCGVLPVVLFFSFLIHDCLDDFDNGDCSKCL